MTRFDHDYYQRFYGDHGVHTAESVAHLASAVHGLCAWWGVEVGSVLDVGAGMGMWRDWYRTWHPTVEVRSIDVSEHACRTWGHERRDIARWRPDAEFDLVICHSVLQYLDDEHFRSAVDHLASATSSVMYLELPTARDLASVVDPDRTDMTVHRRTGAWYRNELRPHFRQVGAGLWVRRGVVPMFELEAAAR